MTFFNDKDKSDELVSPEPKPFVPPKPEPVNRVSEMSVKVDNILAGGGSCVLGVVSQPEYNSLLHKYVTEINLNKLKFSRSKLDQSLTVTNLEDETKDTEL